MTVSAGANLREAKLDLAVYRDSRALPAEAYETDMTKKLHLIVIGDSFRIFMHVHPLLGTNGHFHIVLTFPREGVYHIYADMHPRSFGQQVFRFDLPVGAAIPAAPELRPSGPTTAVGPYTVTLNTTTLDAGKENILFADVRERGALADDLHPYLGAAAHVVLIHAGDLAYAHVHPMAAGAGSPQRAGMSMAMGSATAHITGMRRTSGVPAHMMLDVAVAEPGLYKMWFQFEGGSQLYVAPFVLTAR